MSRLRLSFVETKNERTAALFDGTVEPEGIELVCSRKYNVADYYYNTLRYRDFDVSGLGIGGYLLAKVHTELPYTAIPVFPVGPTFFYTDIWVTEESKIDSPSDLKGKRLAIPQFTEDSSIWLRGILEHEYGIKQSEVEWFIERESKIEELVKYHPPARVKINRIPAEKTSASMLAANEIDAARLYPHTLKSSMDRSTTEDLGRIKGIRRLWSNPKEEALRWYRKTNLFTMSRVIVIHNRVLNENPWVARSLYEAFSRSKEVGYKRLVDNAFHFYSAVWMQELLDEVRAQFGDPPFHYGWQANRHVVAELIKYAYEQQLITKTIEPEALFVSSTLDT